MNKQELVKDIHDVMAEALNGDASRKLAELALDATTGVMASALRTGQDITIKGFGTFKVIEKAARTARNPKTGEAVRVPAKLAVKFKPSKDLV